MVKSYKERKEDFVSNLAGGTITEINIVTAVAPAAYILYSVLQSRLNFFTQYKPLQFIVDFGLNAVAILLSVTLYSSFPALLNVLIISPAVLLYLTSKPAINPAQKIKARDGGSVLGTKPAEEKKAKEELVLPKKAFLTAYRGAMMVVTCVAILAVDFPVFPRRFAKVENWGTSLMDVGVGSFVFSSGIVSARLLLKELHGFQRAQGAGGGGKQMKTQVSLGRRLFSTVTSSLPLFVLGFVRLAMVKSTDYAEHVTEYGYHWNFFFTLAFLPPFVNLLQSIFFLLPPAYLTLPNLPTIYALFSLLIASTYQLTLELTPLKNYVLIGDRAKYGLIGYNKEGISSFSGYLSIFLAGMATGGYLLLPESPQNRKLRQSPVAMKLLQWSLFWVLAFTVSSSVWGFNLVVSRRLANLPYVLWITAYNTCQIAAFYGVEWFFFWRRKSLEMLSEEEKYTLSISRVLDAFNREGLPVFLLANVLTGVINLSFNTLDTERVTAVGILVIYIFILTCAAVGLNATNWRRGVGRYLGI